MFVNCHSSSRPSASGVKDAGNNVRYVEYIEKRTKEFHFLIVSFRSRIISCCVAACREGIDEKNGDDETLAAEQEVWCADEEIG